MACKIHGILRITKQEIEVFEQQLLNLGDGSADLHLPAGHHPFPQHCVKCLKIEGNYSPAPFFFPFSVHLTHNRFNISILFYLSRPHTPDRTGEERWRATRGNSIPQAQSLPPLIFHSRDGHWWHLTKPTLLKRPSECSPWIQAALISVIFISTHQKKKKKQQRTEKPICVHQSSTQSLELL